MSGAAASDNTSRGALELGRDKVVKAMRHGAAVWLGMAAALFFLHNFGWFTGYLFHRDEYQKAPTQIYASANMGGSALLFGPRWRIWSVYAEDGNYYYPRAEVLMGPGERRNDYIEVVYSLTRRPRVLRAAPVVDSGILGLLAVCAVQELALYLRLRRIDAMLEELYIREHTVVSEYDGPAL